MQTSITTSCSQLQLAGLVEQTNVNQLSNQLIKNYVSCNQLQLVATSCNQLNLDNYFSWGALNSGHVEISYFLEEGNESIGSPVKFQEKSSRAKLLNMLFSIKCYLECQENFKTWLGRKLDFKKSTSFHISAVCMQSQQNCSI